LDVLGEQRMDSTVDLLGDWSDFFHQQLIGDGAQA